MNLDKPIKDLQQLGKLDRWRVVMYWRFLLVRRRYLNQSLPLRMVPFHAVFMLLILFAFPHQYPTFILAPIITMAAYYVTLLILFALPSSYKSQIKKIAPPKFRWVKPA